jgi:hypothetical protein
MNNDIAETHPFLATYEIEIIQTPAPDFSSDQVSSEASQGFVRILGLTKVTRVRDETTDDE